MTAYQTLKKIFQQLSELNYTKRIMTWDESVMMPEGAGLARANAVATLHSFTHKFLINKKNHRLIQAAKEDDSLSSWDRANLQWMEKKYINASCLPHTLTSKLTKETLLCQQAWRVYRSENNWHKFLPIFKKTFQLTKEVADRQSQIWQMNPYDALIDIYSPGFNQAIIDPIFANLKNTLRDLIPVIMLKQSRETVTPLVGPFSIESQRTLGLNIMQDLGFNFKHGRLDVSHHPFCDGIPSDVRITTRYDTTNFLPALMGICHETGHALYEQGLPTEWQSQPVGEAHSMSVHESQSLLMEMQVCKSLSFYQYLIPRILQLFDSQPGLTAENLYKQATRVKPSLIRVEADEVTYPLHVILRYEIEKGLFNNSISLGDLPDCWHQFMQSYLQMTTQDDYKNGVMQDVHWPAGLFGYFPAYTLGRLIAAQFFNTFIKSHPDFFDQVKQGKFDTLNKWLKENVYAEASHLTTDALLRKITGRGLEVTDYLQHVKNRYC